MHHYAYQVGITHSTLNEVLWEAKKCLRRAYDNNVEGGQRPLVDLPIQWLEWYGLPHGKKVSSVDVIVCIATIAHSLWKSLVTWTDLSKNGHIDEFVGESATSV